MTYQILVQKVKGISAMMKGRPDSSRRRFSDLAFTTPWHTA